MCSVNVDIIIIIPSNKLVNEESSGGLWTQRGLLGIFDSVAWEWREGDKEDMRNLASEDREVG